MDGRNFHRCLHTSRRTNNGGTILGWQGFPWTATPFINSGYYLSPPPPPPLLLSTSLSASHREYLTINTSLLASHYYRGNKVIVDSEVLTTRYLIAAVAVAVAVVVVLKMVIESAYYLPPMVAPSIETPAIHGWCH